MHRRDPAARDNAAVNDRLQLRFANWVAVFIACVQHIAYIDLMRMRNEVSADTDLIKRILCIRSLTDRSTVSTNCFRFDLGPSCVSWAYRRTRHQCQLQNVPTEQTPWYVLENEVKGPNMIRAVSTRCGFPSEMSGLLSRVALR